MGQLHHFLAWTALATIAFLASVAEAGVLEIVPGITERGEVPATWEVDLKSLSQGTVDKERLHKAEQGLSQRLYGPKDASLHHAISFRTAFTKPKIFAFEIIAVTVAGSDLIVKIDGVEVGRQSWPKASSTHRLNHILQVPVAAGEKTISLGISTPAGVVVIPAYYFADDIADLPEWTISAPFGSEAAITASAKPRDPYAAPTGGKLAVDDGYRGIWYANQATKDEYVYKYSGGFATYPQQHAPIAIYAQEVDKTFFVYGGTSARSDGDKQNLLHMVSYYDHATGTVPRPHILLNKYTDDAHDNPTLSIDGQGHLWIFSPAHGTSRPSFLHRSTQPWSIDEFERVEIGSFSYPQPWYEKDRGFLFLHTRYGGAKDRGNNAIRCLFWSHSRDGRTWSEGQFLAGVEMGDYGVSFSDGDRTALTFDYHPAPVGLNARSNIYYVESKDAGQTWRTITGAAVQPPLESPQNPALAYDSTQDGQLVYLKDLNFDGKGHPVILFLSSKGFEPGPENGPRLWRTLRWDGQSWIRRPFTESDNNYDHGSLYIEPDGNWRVIAPTETGPQAYNPGGQMVLWTSHDEGQSWKKVKQLTHDPKRNHTYARRPLHAHPDFYALWADGNGRTPSESALYFTDRDGTQVWRLPTQMDSDFSKPEIAW